MEGTARIWFTSQQRAELWERWKNGQCVADIARALERRNKSGVYRILALNGGIAPEPRRRGLPKPPPASPRRWTTELRRPRAIPWQQEESRRWRQSRDALGGWTCLLDHWSMLVLQASSHWWIITYAGCVCRVE